MSRRFIIPVIFGLAGLAVFIWLGSWQLQRLHWKEGVLAEIDARIGAPPVGLPATPDPQADRFLPVEVSGVMTGDELHVLVSSRDFGAGFRIISAFETGGRRIMVDRGFVLATGKDKPRTTGAMTVLGNLHWPDERDSYTPANEPERNYWYARDVSVMAAALDGDPILLIARSQTDPGVKPMPVTSTGIPNDHLEYAITWFLLAATWVVMTGFSLWRIKRRSPEDKT